MTPMLSGLQWEISMTSLLRVHILTPWLALVGVLVICLGKWYKRSPFDPYPLLGHLPIFLSRPRWGHFEWFLAAWKYHWNGPQASGAWHKATPPGIAEEGGGGKARGTLTWSFRLPGIKAFSTADPACIKYVLVTKAKEFSKTDLVAEMTRDLFGKGYNLRSAYHPTGKLFALTSTISRVRDEILPKCLGMLCARLDAAAGAPGAQIDFNEWAKDLNLAIFGVLAYDAEPEYLLERLAKPFDSATLSLSDRFGNPFWKLTERLTPKGRQFRRDIATVKTVSKNLILRVEAEAKRRAEMELENENDDNNNDDDHTGCDDEDEHKDPRMSPPIRHRNRPTLVELMMRAGMEDIDEMADSCLCFTVAGRETTGHAMTWTLYSILQQPALEAALRQSLSSTATEGRLVLDEGRHSIETTSPSNASNPHPHPYAISSTSEITGNPSLEVKIVGTVGTLPALTARLQLLDDILSESLRLYPPAPTEVTQHIGSEPLALPSGDIIRPGDCIIWSPWVMARLPDHLWGPKGDAETFDPSRWVRMREQRHKKTVYELPTFHAGPRACLGRDMARVVLLLTFEYLFTHYSFEMVNPGEKKYGGGFTGEMEGGLQVRVRKRETRASA